MFYFYYAFISEFPVEYPSINCYHVKHISPDTYFSTFEMPIFSKKTSHSVKTVDANFTVKLDKDI